MSNDEMSAESREKQPSAFWMWLGMALAAVLAIGPAGVAFWPGRDNNQTSGFHTGTFASDFASVEFNDDDGTCRWFSTDDDPGTERGWELQCKFAVNGDLYTEMWFEGSDYEADEFFPATCFWRYDGENLEFELWGVDNNPSRSTGMAETLVRSP
jgi:hypothetical protein